MTEVRRFRLLDAALLLVVLLAAAATRLAYLSTVAEGGTAAGPLRLQDPSPVPPYPEGVELHGRKNPTERDALLHHFKATTVFRSIAPLAAKEEATAHVAPGFPLLLSALEMLPLEWGPVERTLRWLHLGLGTLTAGCYFLFARRAFRNRIVATLAGLFCAFHPFWVISTAEVEDGVVASFLLALSLALGTRGGQLGGPLTSWLYGLTLAALCLVRAALVPFAFVGLLWYLWRAQVLPRGWLAAFLAFLGFATGFAPWTVHNLRQFHDLFPVVDSAYLHLWIGNNPVATGGPLEEKALREVLAKEFEHALDKLEELPQPERYRRLAWLVVREASQNPEATLHRRLRAGLYFLTGEHWVKTGAFAQHATTAEGEQSPLPEWFAWHGALLQGSLLLMLTLGFCGWRWTAAWRYEAMPSSLAVFWIPLPYLLSHAETLCGPRLPLDGVLLTYAAFALVAMIPGVNAELLAGDPVPGSSEDRPRR